MNNIIDMQPSDLIIPEGFDAHWVPSMTHEEYHADKSAVGSSSLALAHSSLKAFYEGHFMGKQRPPTNDMELGTIIHMALLEGESFAERYVVMPEFWGYTTKGEKTNSANCKEVKDKKERWLADRTKDQVVVTEEQLEMIDGMIASVKAHPQGEAVFAHGFTERAGYYRDPRTGMKMKIKPDFVGKDWYLATDFKTARSSEEKLFGTQAHGSQRLDMRLWMYAFGISQIERVPVPENLFFMVCEKVWPYESAVYFMTAEQRNQAEYDYNAAQDKIVNSIKSGKWPQRQTRMQPLYTPKFFIDNDVEKHERELDESGE